MNLLEPLFGKDDHLMTVRYPLPGPLNLLMTRDHVRLRAYTPPK